MKKVILYIVGTIICLILADFIIGFCSKYYIKNYQLVGRYQPLDRLIKEVDTDIILIGNSAILNSINPEIIENRLSMTCYNGGITGQGVFFFETIIDCILQRHTPKMIIIGLRPEEIGKNVGEGIYDVLKPYYGLGYNSIDGHFNKASGIDRYLLQSNLLRYNTIWVRVLLYMLFDDTKYSKNGFMPKGTPSRFPTIKHVSKCEEPIKEKLDCIERIMQMCKTKNIKLIICFPPTLLSFAPKDIPCVKAVRNLCDYYAIPCYPNYNNNFYLSHPELFYDNGHLNKNGADYYSKDLSRILYNLLIEESKSD